MNIFLDPESLILKIATLGPLGKNPLGKFLSPLLAVPIVLLGRYAYYYSKDLFYIPLIIGVVSLIWIVDFAFENLPLERVDQIILPLIPGMIMALQKQALTPKVTLGSFLVFWSINIAFEKIIEKLLDNNSPDELEIDEEDEEDDDLFDHVENEDDRDKTEAYVVPPNKQKTVYEILMLPIGAGALTSIVMHALLLIIRRL